MRTLARLGVACALLAAAAARAESPPETWLRRAFLPSTNNVHGEVRLLRRDGSTCMQTLLYSRYLRRGLHEMARKERLSWPEGLPGHDESARYLAAMEKAKDAVLGPAGSTADEAEADVRHKLLIEFTLTPTGACYALSRMELAGEPDGYAIASSEVIVREDAHPYYVSQAIRLMAKEGFKLEGDDLDALLQSAGWSTADPPALPLEQQAVPR